MTFFNNLLLVACIAVKTDSEEMRLEGGQIQLPMLNPDESASSPNADSPKVIVFNNWPDGTSMRDKLRYGSFPWTQIRNQAVAGTSDAAKATTPTTTTTTKPPSTACPSTEFSKEYRQTVLDVHNNLRSLVATHRAKNAYYARTTKECFQTAAFMYKMIYNCTAEAYAHSIAKRCTDRASPYRMRPGWVENIQKVRGQPDVLSALKNALSTWKDEMYRYGLPSNVYTPKIKATYKLTRFTKMIWGTNQQIGCATHLCNGGFYTTVCLYREFVQRLFESIYSLGPTCQGCPPNTCDPNVGLCVWE